MTVSGGTAASWLCERCGVSVSRIDGERVPLPDTWSSGPEGDFCLACSRQRAAEEAVEQAPPGCDRDARAKLRRAGLIEFEVKRSPERTDGSIAKACRSTTSAVAAARRRLELDPAPPAGSDRDWAVASTADR